MTRAIMWFRRDLRLTDNSAVLAALAEHSDVIPVFVVDPHLMKNAGAPRVAYMCDALAALNASMGGALVFRHGDPVDVIVELAKELDATDVYIARDFAPYGRRRDIEIAERLVSQGRRLSAVGSPYAVAPGRVMKDDGTSYSVFTPFSKRWLALGWDGPQAAPRDPQWLGVPSVRSDGAPLRPEIDFVLPPHDEERVHDQWNEFRLRGAEGLDGYVERRNEPGVAGSSRLSAALRWGIVHPRQLIADLLPDRSHDVFRSELAWREFYADVLFRFPDTGWRNLNRKLDGLVNDSGTVAEARFAAWCRGETGYPIVDAGMRELVQTGWMHNRVRMIVASFLVKDLHLPWQWGARFFMKHLVDGDLASNAHGWQWTAGTGTDASPYFRVFNPILQGERYDAAGDYVRRFVPELADLSAAVIHAPFDSKRKGSGVPLGYVAPIVDHGVERDEALARYKARE
ncbi:MAG: deoxyribodipyrimidine photo-lyase [Actinobacteria bacterium]|nr:deoxyribodipyrimidine photo-lyase [Actinomycetota bacterium]